ncbi:MAG: PDZ domain-containing protein [Nonomuraea sp.]|nr:PDZ domain-containing protein [Nonomuraea sp.]NUP68919.1 PDZ domain-containing protein [Nonomuraea sp.]
MANLHPWPRTENTIDFIQHIRVAPEVIWSELSTEEGLTRWLGLTSASMPLEEGAPFHLTWEARGKVSGERFLSFTGTVRKVIPNRLLALDWVLPFGKDTTHLSLQIQPSFAMFGVDVGPECDLWLIHSGFPAHGVGFFEFDGHSRHWRQGVGDLAAHLEERPGKPTPYALAGLQFVGGAPDQGLLVYDVIQGSPAEQAGIRPGDLIRSVEGMALASLDDFHDWIDERKPGESGEFELADRTVKVTVESVEDARKRLLVRQGDQWTPRR